MVIFDKEKKITLEGKTTSKWIEMIRKSKMSDIMELLEKNEYNIPSAQTVREETKKAKEEKIIREVASINQLIKNASHRGRSKIEFNVCKEIMSEIRQLYTEAGYRVIIRIVYDQKMVSVALDWEDRNNE